MMLLALLAAAAAIGAPPLAWPVACTAGVDCAIQNYPDDDPGPGVRDAWCGARSYDGHDGTDIRLDSLARMRAGVAVTAAAAGRVLRVRDGIADRSIREPGGLAAVRDQECGNGLVVDHGGGWETQYCHMRQGSIAVRPGQRVAAGTILGRVGLSGQTEFPHLHLTVRRDGKAIDPFAYGAAPGQCRGGRSLWVAAPAHVAGAVLVAGFAAGPVTMAGVQDLGPAQQPRPGREAPALVAFAQAIGLEAGDIQRIVLRDPAGRVIADNRAPPLPRPQAQNLLFAGRKRPPEGWAPGRYEAEYSVTRAGRPVIRRRFGVVP